MKIFGYSKADMMALIVVAAIIVGLSIVYYGVFDYNHPGEDPFIEERIHNGHVFLIRNTYTRGECPMIHSPDCPCLKGK